MQVGRLIYYSADMWNINFLLLIILGLVQWRLARVQSSGICVSSSCQETGRYCQNDDINSCFLRSGAVPFKRVTYDDEDTGENLQMFTGGRCTGPNTTSNIFLKNVTLNYVSINPKYFKLRISWFLTELSGHRGGYELRVIDKYHGTLLRYCIGDSRQTRVTIHNMKYDRLKFLKSIDVLPYPHPRIDENAITVSQPLNQNIEGCADIEHNGTLCGSKPYPKPENLSMESSWCGNDTKTLNITWDPPNVGSDVPLPEIYHVLLHSDPFNYVYTQLFKVQNANQVVLANLSATQNYKVYVLSYRKCSGLGNADENLGCGALARQIEKRIYNCDSFDHITTMFRSEDTVGEQLNVTYDTNHVPVLTIVIVTLNIVLVIAVSLAVILYITLKRHLKGKYLSSNHSTMMVDHIHKVFVFYLSSMSQTHKDYIQKYVICNLLKYFKVITPDDIIRGNISIWLEDAVNSADSVLLIGDEEFCSEWEKDARSPILNSLELLISAAASQNTIAKFGFVSIGESMVDVHIPSNSYLKLMPVFFMGENKCEVEKVYRFVTRSRGIELAHESDHDIKL